MDFELYRAKALARIKYDLYLLPEDEESFEEEIKACYEEGGISYKSCAWLIDDHLNTRFPAETMKGLPEWRRKRE
jgi:hypothetical protein